MAAKLLLPLLLAIVFLCTFLNIDAYIYYPFAPNAYYQEGMNFSFVSGYKTTYAETAGFADKGTYNGVLSVAFERTEKYAFLTTGDGKKIRKINYRTSLVGSDITPTHDWHYPMGMTVDHANKNVWVGDRHVISVIRDFDMNANPLTEVITSVEEVCGNIASGMRDGNATTSRFSEPRFVAIDLNDEYLYVSDVLNTRLRRVDLKNGYTTVTYASFGGKETNGLVISTDGKSLYAAATSLHGLWRIPILDGFAYPSPSGGWTWLTDPAQTKGQLVDGAIGGAKFAFPSSLTIDDHDNVYVFDNWETRDAIDDYDPNSGTFYFNYAIRRVNTRDNFVSTMGGKFCAVKSDQGIADGQYPAKSCYREGNGTEVGICKSTVMVVSSYLSVGKHGDKFLYTDYGNNIVRKVECGPIDAMDMIYGECFLPTRAPTSPPTHKPTFAPTNPPTHKPTFAPTNPPTGCASLFVKTPAGSGCPGDCDAPEFLATFDYPDAVDVSKQGGENLVTDPYLIIGDFSNNLIRKMVISSGVVSTIASNYKWYHPTGVSIARNNFVAVTDLHRLSYITFDDLVESGSATLMVGSKLPGDADMMCPDGTSASSGKGSTGTKRQLDHSSASSSSLMGGCVFNTPTGLDVDDNHGIIYVVDSGNNAIRAVAISEDAGFPVYTVAIDPLLNTPFGVVYIPSTQSIYVTSFSSHAVFRIDVSGCSLAGCALVPITTDNIYSGSVAGAFGHADGALLSAVYMNPTGITADDEDNLYLNEWYMLPGEVDMGSTWANNFAVDSSHLTAGSSGKSASTGGSKSGSMAGTAAKTAGSSVFSSMDAPSGSGMIIDLYPHFAHSTAGSKAATAVTAATAAAQTVSGSAKSGSKSSSSASSSTGDSNNVYGTEHLRSVNWGHEPQYLHNVRKIRTRSDPVVSTIAGSIIPGIFERSEASSLSDASVKTAKTAGSTAGSAGTAGSTGTTGTTAGTAGTVKSTAVRRLDHSTGTGSAGSGSGKSAKSGSGSLYDGYYSFSSDACPVCPNPRFVPSSNASTGGSKSGSAGAGTATAGTAGVSTTVGDSHGGKTVNHNTMASASHYVNGHESGMTDPYIKSHIEHSSFDDGFAIYARFFKPIGITVLPNGATIWIADAGNNKIRNITCAGIGAPTFDPTAEPTKRPSADPTMQPTPTMKPTKAPISAVPKVSGPGPKGPSDASTKSPTTKSVKGASSSEVGFTVSDSASSMSTSDVTMVAIAGFVGAACVLVALYFRQRIVDFVLGTQTAVKSVLAKDDEEIGFTYSHEDVKL